jgi:hypothetical protein
MMHRAWILVILGGLVAGAAGQTTLRFRVGEELPVQGVNGVSAQGVECVMHDGKTVVVSWDRVAEVRGGKLEEVAREYSGLAQSAWRARTRLSRGDALGAEPLFESLFARYEGQSGATAAMVASGLLRCRSTRQAQASSVAPWLALLATGERETVFDSPVMASDGVMVSPVVDERTGLAPSLPPIWLVGPSLQSIVALERPRVAGAEEEGVAARRERVLRELFVAAARGTLGEPVTLHARPEADDGPMLAWDVVAVRFGTPEQQRQARVHIRTRIENLETSLWEECWCRVALGMAMVRESDEEQRLLGLAQLAHAPARLESTSPYLAGVALAEMARVLDAGSGSAGGLRAWRTLEERFPDHPAATTRAENSHKDFPHTGEQIAPDGGTP